MREKFGFGDRAIVIETDEGILLKPLPDISEEKGSLRELFKGRTSEEILREFREEDLKRKFWR